MFGFSKVKLNTSLYSGDRLEIIATDRSQKNSYIDTILLNYESVEGFVITPKNFIKGGVIELKMGGKKHATNL